MMEVDRPFPEGLFAVEPAGAVTQPISVAVGGVARTPAEILYAGVSEDPATGFITVGSGAANAMRRR
jgi:hypothetical protein